MLTSRSVRWTTSGISNGRYRLINSVPKSRNYSSHGLTTRNPRLSTYTSSTKSSLTLQSRSISLFGWGSSSGSSAQSNVTPAPIVDVEIGPTASTLENMRTIKASHATSHSPDPTQAPLQPPNSIEPKIIEDLQEKLVLPHGAASERVNDIVSGDVDISTTAERMGYLKEVCGLDFGWGPSTIMESLLEWLHVGAGLSWTTSIVAVAVILRLAMVKPIVDSQIQGKRVREMQPFVAPLREQYMKLMQSGNRAKAMEIGAQMKEIHKSAGISYTKAFVPLLIQLPFSFGAFRVLRNAGQLPVPGFVTSDWLWTTDLSFSDPYYITPAISAATIYFSFKFQQSGQATIIGPQMMKVLGTVMPVASFGFMSFQPGAVQLYFMTTGILAFATTALIRQTWFRNWIDLGPLPTTTPTSTSSSSTAAPTPAKPLPANMQRISPILPAAPVVSEPIDDPTQNRSIIDRAVDRVKGGFQNIQNFADKDGTFSKKQADRIKQQRDTATARLNALRQRELDSQREERNRQASNDQGSVRHQ